MSDPIQRLYESILMARGEEPKDSRTAKLFADGRIKIAKKLSEEATEVALECVAGDRDKVIRESVDMLYNWVVLLAAMGINPAEVWHEMHAREAHYGIAGKIPKTDQTAAE